LEEVLIKLLVFLARIKAFSRKFKSIYWGFTGITLDVGGGSRPNPLADIIVEPYIDENHHRQGRDFVSLGKFCIVTKAHQLPFKNKVIDHITCSHVLEHVNNPKNVLSEFSRVGKKGYLEVPSLESEFFYNREDHLWSVKRRSKTCLDFFPKPHIQENELSNLIRTYPDVFYLMYFTAFKFFNIDVYWKDEIDCNQIGNICKNKIIKSSLHFVDSKTITVSTKFLSIVLTNLKSIKSNKISIHKIVKIMMCSNCSSQNIYLDPSYSKIICCDCSHEMKISNNIIYV
jgi:hypothetical protein